MIIHRHTKRPLFYHMYIYNNVVVRPFRNCQTNKPVALFIQYYTRVHSCSTSHMLFVELEEIYVYIDKYISTRPYKDT